MDSDTITVEQATQEASSWFDSFVDYLPRIAFAILAVIVAVFIARLVRS